MKILLVNTFYYPNMIGGAEQSVKLLAEKLVEKGNDVGVFCIDSKDKIQNINYNGVKVFRCTSHKFNIYKFMFRKNEVGKIEKIIEKLRCYYNYGVLKDFRKVCHKFNPDVIHTNTLFGMSNFIWKEAYKLNIPTIHTIRDIGLISPVQYGKKINRFIISAHQIVSRITTSYVTAVTAPSTYTLNTTLDINTFKNCIIKKCIFNSVEVNKEELRKIIKNKLKRTNNVINFIYAGRLVYFKGIEHMIKAFKSINNKNIRLSICGDGDLRNYVIEECKVDKRIKYKGKLNNEQLKREYRNADVLIVPSIWPEPFGRVLIEGNLLGLPVIAGNCGGIPEIVKNTKGGEVYSPGSLKELSKLIRQFSDRNKIKQYFSNIEKNIDKYDIQKQVDAFMKIYQNIS